MGARIFNFCVFAPYHQWLFSSNGRARVKICHFELSFFATNNMFWRVLVLLWLGIAATIITAYKFDDLVELDLVIDSVKVDAYRHQMPRFGVPHYSTIVDGVTKQLGLQFDDGLFVLPVYPVQSKAGTLVRLDVEIVSDETSLQNVIGTPTYASLPNALTDHYEIAITYIWTLQPNGNEHTLSVVYTLTVLACCLVVLISSGVLDGSTSNEDQDPLAMSGGSGSGGGAPKWD
jgi:hypothetical protein